MKEYAVRDAGALLLLVEMVTAASATLQPAPATWPSHATTPTPPKPQSRRHRRRVGHDRYRQMTREARIRIDAAPEHVVDLVSDITRETRWAYRLELTVAAPIGARSRTEPGALSKQGTLLCRSAVGAATAGLRLAQGAEQGGPPSCRVEFRCCSVAARYDNHSVFSRTPGFLYSGKK